MNIHTAKGNQWLDEDLSHNLNKLNANNIYEGDCLEFMKMLPDGYFDLIITDPPYGIDYDTLQNKMAESGRISNGGKWKSYDYFKWDKTIPAKEYFREMLRTSKNQIIFGGNYFDLPKHTTWIIWNKIQRGFMTDGEMAWTSFDKSIYIFDMSRVDAYINKDDKKVHPTQKPTALGRWILKNFATKGMKIFDPFAGSGSFLLACKQLGFEFVGCEINPEYIKIINSRLNQMSVSDFWSNDTHNRNFIHYTQ